MRPLKKENKSTICDSESEKHIIKKTLEASLLPVSTLRSLSATHCWLCELKCVSPYLFSFFLVCHCAIYFWNKYYSRFLHFKNIRFSFSPCEFLSVFLYNQLLFDSHNKVALAACGQIRDCYIFFAHINSEEAEQTSDFSSISFEAVTPGAMDHWTSEGRLWAHGHVSNT